MGFGLAVKYFGSFFLLAALALLVVVSVSTPIWNSVYFLSSDLGQQRLYFGNWGACLDGLCTPSKLGYKGDILRAIGVTTNQDVYSPALQALSRALILNPIAAGITALALLVAVIPVLACGILGSILSFIAFLAAAAALGVSLGLFVTARNRFRQAGIDAMLGNAIWLQVAACGCLIIAMFTVCFGRRNKKDKHHDNHSDQEEALTSQGRRGWFGRNKTPAETTTYGDADDSNTHYHSEGMAPPLPPLHSDMQQTRY